MHRWLQYITPSEAPHISSDILILFLILLEISFFTLHEEDILKKSYPSLCDQTSNRISDRISRPLTLRSKNNVKFVFLESILGSQSTVLFINDVIVECSFR